MKTAVILVSRPGHQTTWGGAFKAGLERHGWSVSIEYALKPADMVVFWGVRRRRDIAVQQGRGHVCVLERGYVGDRQEWTSVSFGGGLNGRGKFYGPFDDASRWQRHFAGMMKPWRTDGRYALVLGQVPTDMSLIGTNGPMFWTQAREQLERKGFEVRFRPHPLADRHPKPNAPSLEQDLAGARFTVAWNSNSTVDAVLAGVPSVTMDEGAMAWPVTGHALEMPPAPDREAWAHALAWKQWRLEEMQSGYCWETVRSGIA